MKKILVVDDEPDIIKVVTYRLKADYEVFVAVNGEEVLDLTRKIKPDLIFLDLRLPLMSGYEVCTVLKNDPELKSIPVVFLTASATTDVREKARHFKADGCLVKPFEPEELLETVKKFLG